MCIFFFLSITCPLSLVINEVCHTNEISKNHRICTNPHKKFSFRRNTWGKYRVKVNHKNLYCITRGDCFQNLIKVKGCVRCLNRCTTTPTYILYHLNEKKELTTTYDIFFDLKHCYFWKRHLPGAAYFPQTTLFMKFTT